jgi:CIC family chloride channel protein
VPVISESQILGNLFNSRKPVRRGSSKGIVLARTIRQLVTRSVRSEHAVLFILALIVGSASAYGAMLIRFGVELVHYLGFGVGSDFILTAVEDLPWWRIMAIPTFGGLAVGVFLHFAIRGGRVHGVAHVIESSTLRRGRMSLRDGLVSAIGSVVSIGVGASTGREGPAVHLGATASAWIAERLKLGQSLSRTLLGCAAASAIGALFNAPIAGVFFALEVVIGRAALRSFAPVVVAGVIGTVIGRIYFGAEPAFIIPASEILSLWEFPAFALLGVVAAVAAIAFMQSILAASRFAGRSGLPEWSRPAVAGLFVGLLALFLPQVLGVGYEATDAALGAEYGVTLLLVLIAAKILATGISIGFGFGGGVFSPSLVLGAFVGGAFGIVAGTFFPGAYSGTAAYALIGTGAVAGAVLGAPLSTILIIFELTGDYEMTIAVMIATVVATQLTQLLYGHSFFHKQLELAGINLGRGQELQVMGGINVDAVMHTRIVTAGPDTPMDQLPQLVATAPHSELFVVDSDGRLIGTITAVECVDIDIGTAKKTAGILARRCSHVVERGDEIAAVVEIMQAEEESRLPVVESRETMKLVGYVREADILRAVNRLLLDAQREDAGIDASG